MNPEKIAVGVVVSLIVVLLGVAVFRSEESRADTGNKGVLAATPHTPPPFPASPPPPVVVKYDEIAKGGYQTRQPPRPREADSRPAEAPKTVIYTVRAGDTFARIAKRELGSSALASKIATLNPDITEKGLKVGMKLTLPEKKAPATAAKPQNSKARARKAA